MHANALFGSYWAADSPIHRLDPRAKALCTVLWVIACFFAGNVPSILAMLAALAAIVAAARIPFGQALRSIVPLLFIVVITALLNLFFTQTGTPIFQWGPIAITDDGAALAANVVVRLTLLLMGGSLLTLTTTSIDITEALERLLSPFKRIGVPAHEFAMVMGIALRFLPQFVDEFHTIRAAQLSRGARLATSPVKGGLSALTSLLVPLFASAFRHADALAQAMDARCYHGSEGRTRLHPLRYTGRDFAALAAIAALLAAVIALSRLF